MPTKFQHPILPRHKEDHHCGIFNLKEQRFELVPESTHDKVEVYDSVEEFFRRVRADAKFRESLGIPPLSYHAFGFQSPLSNGEDVVKLIEWHRKHGYEVRGWENMDSGHLLIVSADEDMSEDSGWDLYNFVLENCKSYSSYGLSSWYEFCIFGIPIYDDWKLKVDKGRLSCLSPDGTRAAFFG